MMKILKPLVFFIASYVPLSCFAWGMQGHHIAGEIAYRHLTRNARLAVASILGNESLAIASNWADFIKADTAYKYLDEWHYIDLEDSLAQGQVNAFLKGDTAADVYTKINFLSKQLKNKQLPADKKIMYLKLLIHLVEDANQPMHTIGKARGGNDIKVLWFNEPSNLHRVWDSDLILYQQLSYTEYANAIDHATRQQLQKWMHQPVNEWLYETYQIGEKLVSEIDQPNQKLSYRYNFDHIATLNQQLLKAGVHLAQVLNAIFK